MRKTDVPQLGHTPLTAAFPFLSVTFVGFLISMLALHLTQYACGISIQLSVHWSVVVFETHAEHENAHEGQERKESRIRSFRCENARKHACSTFLPVSAARTSIRVGNTSISSATLAREQTSPFLCLILINRQKLVVLLISPHESLIGLSQRLLR
jgi:hypothetical protein